jgi:hypothetical protein
MKSPVSILVGFALVAAAIYFQPNGRYQMYQVSDGDFVGIFDTRSGDTKFCQKADLQHLGPEEVMPCN